MISLFLLPFSVHEHPNLSQILSKCCSLKLFLYFVANYHCCLLNSVQLSDPL